MNPFLLGPAAGILGGLFGSHQNFGSGADMSAGRGYLGDLSGIAGQWGGLSQQALGSYANDNGAYRGAVGNYANYLQQDPFTDQRDAASLANATRGTAGTYQQANANLTNSLAARGLDTGTNGGGSSQLAGGLAGIASGQTASMAGAQNQLAYNQIGQRRANMEGLVGLMGGMANQDYSRGVGALGAQQGLDQGLASDYLGLGQHEQGLQMGYDQQIRQGIAGGVSGIGNVLGMDAYRSQYPGGAYGGMFGLLGGGGQGGYGGSQGGYGGSQGGYGGSQGGYGGSQGGGQGGYGGMMNQVAGLNF